MPEAARTGPSAAAPRAGLLSLAAPAGGWPYYAGQPSRIEPTCWALLALSGPRMEAREAAAVAQAQTFLRSLARTDGTLVEPASPGPNYGWNGLALLALNGRDDLALADRLSTALLAAKGIRIEDDGAVVQQNSRLQAWPWMDGTFSWIEPTACCLLALKVRRVTAPALAARISEAEAVIADRVCDPGGWNYGNSQVLMQDLRPYVPTTALTLLAMQDKPDHPVVRRSLDWLSAHATSERATMALALAAICLHVYRRPIDEVLALLSAQYARTQALGNAHLLAMVTYALALPAHDARALTIP
jgi:hypothetical protein